MNLQTCPNGHFYDAEKYSSCPHCSNNDSFVMDFANPDVDVQLDKTVAVVGEDGSGAGKVVIPSDNSAMGMGNDFEQRTEPLRKPANDVVRPPEKSNTQINVNQNPINSAPASQNIDDQTGDKTVRYFEAVSTEPVAGWLVCIEGEKNFGKDFKLRVGRNFIGRNEQDICLAGDNSVSRRKHAVVLYEPKNNIFIMEPGESRELSYLNDSVVLSPVEIKSHDVIQVGNTKLMFIPCCTDKFRWEDVIPGEDK